MRRQQNLIANGMWMVAATVKSKRAGLLRPYWLRVGVNEVIT
jgi:hypothetical protein